MYSQCLSLGWGFSMDGKLGWCFPGFPSCSNSQKQWKGCFFSKKLEDMFFSMVKLSTQIWGRNVATTILTIDIWGKLHLLSIAVSLEQNKVPQNARASRRWMQEEHRRTGFPYISPMQIKLNVHLASKYAFPEFGRVEWGGSPSNLSQKSGGGVSRGSQVFLNVSSLITSFYLIPLYLRGPGTISILKKMNEGRALRQLYGKRLSFIDYLS